MTDLRDPLEAAPRTTATARVREVWDSRLRQRERELVLEVMAQPLHQVIHLSTLKWAELDPSFQARILIALRDLVQLGNEAAYALGYSRRNG